MKKWIPLIIGLALPAFAATPEPPVVPQGAAVTSRKVSELLGSDVKNGANEKLGDLKDLVLDLPAGTIRYAVLSAGGFLGIGDKYVALPSNLFHASADPKILLLDSDKQALKTAPSFDSEHWPDRVTSWTDRNINGIDSTLGTAARRTEGAVSNTWASVTNRLDERSSARRTASEGWVPGNYNSNNVTGINPDRTISEPSRAAATIPENQRYVVTNSVTSPSAATAWTSMKATQLLGTNIRNEANERLGEIKDIVVDLNSSRILYAVVGVGGTLGVGGRYFAVQPRILTSSPQDHVLIWNISKDAVKTMKSLDRNHWPEVGDPTWRDQVYDGKPVKP